MRKTIPVLQFLTDTLTDVPNVVGIQLLNEPLNVPELWDFYNTALNSLRGSGTKAQKFPFHFHGAFDVDRRVDFMKNRGNEWNVLGHHSCKSHHPFTLYYISGE
jgi:glucan 1,3-beta-glucosidase